MLVVADDKVIEEVDVDSAPSRAVAGRFLELRGATGSYVERTRGPAAE